MPPALFALAPLIAELTLAEIITVSSIALTIGTTVFGAVQQRKAAKKAKRKAAQARQDFLNSLQDRTITRIATDAPLRYVYGRAKVGSDIVAVLSSGDIDQYRHRYAFMPGISAMVSKRFTSMACLLAPLMLMGTLRPAIISSRRPPKTRRRHTLPRRLRCSTRRERGQSNRVRQE